MLVQDAMTKDPVVCTAETPLRQVVALFRKHHIGGLPVMEGKELVGIITESDPAGQGQTLCGTLRGQMRGQP